jgi:hypothetical protein
LSKRLEPPFEEGTALGCVDGSGANEGSSLTVPRFSSLYLLLYMGHQALFCANLGEMVEKANALNAEGAKGNAEVAESLAALAGGK